MLTKHAVLLVGGFELAVSRPSRPVNLFPGHYLAFLAHVLFLCPCMEMCSLRMRIAEQFSDFIMSDRVYIGDN